MPLQERRQAAILNEAALARARCPRELVDQSHGTDQNHLYDRSSGVHASLPVDSPVGAGVDTSSALFLMGAPYARLVTGPQEVRHLAQETDVSISKHPNTQDHALRWER